MIIIANEHSDSAAEYVALSVRHPCPDRTFCSAQLHADQLNDFARRLMCESLLKQKPRELTNSFQNLRREKLIRVKVCRR